MGIPTDISEIAQRDVRRHAPITIISTDSRIELTVSDERWDHRMGDVFADGDVSTVQHADLTFSVHGDYGLTGM